MAVLHRRNFLAASLAAGAMGGLAPRGPAIDPIRRQGRPQLRLSLSAYSFRNALNLKQPQPTMNLESFIDLAATLPLDAVELTAYYFPETSPRYLARLKGRCTRLGLDVSGTAVGNNFCRTNASRLKEEIAHVKTWIEHTSRLGGKTLRIFAGQVEPGDHEERARQRCLEAIHECCEHAGQFGVYLALENHGGITATPDAMLDLVRAVKSEWFGVNLDTGNFHTADPYADLARLAPYAVVAQIKTEIRRAGKSAEPADLRRLLQILRDVNFRGYVALEHEANEDPKVAVPRHLRTLRELCS
ncbi:MAG: sugar phosphate isomerase/epimerase [Gemmataceae bacterium]|nr:sugar phosphate isomerase/epimerase [Gemmataceae bacterium]